MSAAGRRMVLGTEGAGAGRGPGRWSALAPRLSPVPASAVGGSGVRAARPPRCRVRARPWGCSWLGAAWGEPGSSLPLCPSPKVARPGGRGLGVEGALQTRVPFHPTATAPSDRPPAGPQTARHFQMPQPRLKQFFVFPLPAAAGLALLPFASASAAARGGGVSLARMPGHRPVRGMEGARQTWLCRGSGCSLRGAEPAKEPCVRSVQGWFLARPGKAQLNARAGVQQLCKHLSSRIPTWGLAPRPTRYRPPIPSHAKAAQVSADRVDREVCPQQRGDLMTLVTCSCRHRARRCLCLLLASPRHPVPDGPAAALPGGSRGKRASLSPGSRRPPPVFLAGVGLSPLSWHLSWAISLIPLSWCHVGLSCRDPGAGDRAAGGLAAPPSGVSQGDYRDREGQHSPVPCRHQLRCIPWHWGPGAPSPQRDHGVGSWDGWGRQ